MTGAFCCSRIVQNSAVDYPWRCLCFGFSQIILIEPFLLMTLHFSQIGFTDDLTFTGNPPLFQDFCSKELAEGRTNTLPPARPSAIVSQDILLGNWYFWKMPKIFFS